MVKKIRVNSILILVVAAMLALMIIQAFQSAELYETKSAEFDDRFSMTLDRIAMTHEKADDIRRYMAVVNKDFSVKYKDVLKEEFKTLLSAEESISIQDTAIYEDGEMQNYLIIKGRSYDSISGLTAEQRVLARDVRQLRDLYKTLGKNPISQDSIKIAFQLDQRVIQQILKKTRFVNEMMIDVFRNNVYESASQRLDIVFLDSALETELKIERLPKGFEFMVTDESGDPVKFKNAPSNYTINIDTLQAHKTLLFPSNSLDEDLHLYIKFPKQHAFILRSMWGGLAVNIAVVILIIIAMIFMFRTILSQRKLSEMKNDFISNMTHEFKTPISTISLACQAMNDSDMVQEVNEQTKPFVKMINDENKRLGVLVERILQSATLDKGELKINEERIELNQLIGHIIDNAQFRISGSGGEIKIILPEEEVFVIGDRMHITNLISNLVDNAIKYSGSAPMVSVKLSLIGKQIKLSVKDEGIGIKKEHLNKIFDKLYRIPTGNVHNVKGFGLGLSYVKAIAELHGWNITVKSKFGSGSEFDILIKE
ncbi:MAG: HAMP domain-containing histidine kinase [Crocinitomicaceae bacterium]|nr:HAMP domain-containing histidine kinase [Crocinitomicaceae bacterium]